MSRSKGSQAGDLSPSFINYYALRTLAYGAIGHALRLANDPSRNLDDLDENTVSEGGYSHWANQLVKRHGIVPEDKMSSESFRQPQVACAGEPAAPPGGRRPP